MAAIKSVSFGFNFVSRIVVVRFLDIVNVLILAYTNICCFPFLSLDFSGNYFILKQNRVIEENI